MFETLISLPDPVMDQLPSWALILVAALAFLNFLFARIAEAYEGFARLFGPLGRRWRRKGLLRAEVHRKEVQAEARVLAREIAGEIEPPDYQEMGRRLNNMDRRVKALEESDEIQRAFIAYDADWHFDDEMAAVGRPECQPAARLAFSRFRELYRGGWRPGQPAPAKP